MSQTSWISRRGPLVFLAVILAALTPLLLQISWPFHTAFLISAVLAIVMNPARRWLLARVRRPALVTAFITLATVQFLGAIATFAGMALTRELTSAYNALNRRSLEEGGWPALATHTLDRVLDAVSDRVPVDQESIRTELLERMKDLTGFLLKNAGVALGGITTLLFTGVLVTLFLYFLLRHGEEWMEWVALSLPLDPRTTANIFQKVRDSVVGNVNGVLVVAAAQGMFLAVGFWLVGLRSPALWGVVGGLASIIPVLGCPLVWAPVVIAFLVKGAYGKAAFLAIWGALIVGSVDNLLRPFIVGAHSKQHPILIGLSMFGGTYAFGPLGILLGPVVVALAAAVVEEIQSMNAGDESSASSADRQRLP